jgi:hypothetical protein
VKVDKVLVWYRNGIVVVVNIGENGRWTDFATIGVPIMEKYHEKAQS